MSLFRKKDYQAKLIHAWIEKENEDGSALVTVENASIFPVYKMILSTVNVQNKSTSGKDTPPECRSFLLHAPPGRCYSLLTIHHGMSFRSGIEIAFTDIDGLHWLRDGDGNLRKIHIAPIDYYGILHPLSWEIPKKNIP